MAYDKVIDSAVLEADLTSVADAIREKGGTSETLSFPDGFTEAIAAIESGGGGDDTICGYEKRSGSFTLSEDVTSAYTVEFEEMANKFRSDFIIMGWIDFLTVHGTIINTYNGGQLSDFFLTYSYWMNGSRAETGYAAGRNTSGSTTSNSNASTSRTYNSFTVPFSSTQKGIAGCTYNWVLVAMKK